MAWRPTLAGWLVLIVLALGIGWFVLGQLHPFLAVTQPLAAKYLILEGWVPDYAVRQTLELFRKDGYESVLVTGTEIEKGSHLAAEKTYAELTAKTLFLESCPSNRVVVLPTPYTRKDRTFHSALEVRKWLDANAPGAAVNVVSVGPHARRTWHLYRLALGRAHPVGVVCLADASYDADRWWTSSQGFRRTLDEWIAFFYARFLFSAREEVETSGAPAFQSER